MGWDQLIGMIDEARDIDAAERSGPPQDCPICATTLVSGPDGTITCPFNDHYSWPQDS